MRQNYPREKRTDWEKLYGSKNYLYVEDVRYLMHGIQVFCRAYKVWTGISTEICVTV